MLAAALPVPSERTTIRLLTSVPTCLCSREQRATFGEVYSRGHFLHFLAASVDGKDAVELGTRAPEAVEQLPTSPRPRTAMLRQL